VRATGMPAETSSPLTPARCESWLDQPVPIGPTTFHHVQDYCASKNPLCINSTKEWKQGGRDRRSRQEATLAARAGKAAGLELGILPHEGLPGGALRIPLRETHAHLQAGGETVGQQQRLCHVGVFAQGLAQRH